MMSFEFIMIQSNNKGLNKPIYSMNCNLNKLPFMFFLFCLIMT